MAALLLPAGVVAQCGACEFFTGNLVDNGDFSEGNTGFSTDYELATVSGPWGLLSDAGFYVIDNNASDVHTFFDGFDHTNPPFGDYMIVNGSNTAGTAIWCQTIDVLPGLDYTFSAWARNVDTNPDNTVNAVLQFTINGELIGPEFIADGGWEQFEVSWNAGDFTTIDLCIFNQQTNSGGNDFGIDDISFDACYPYEVEHVLSAGPDQTICSGELVTIGEVGMEGFSYTWDPAAELADLSLSELDVALTNPLTDPITTEFVLSADTAALGCIQTDTVQVTILPLPQPDLGEDVIICEGETATLDAGTGWDSVLWSTDETTATINTGTPGTYTATVGDGNCFNSDAVEVIQPILPTLSLPADTAICEDQTLVLTPGAPGGTWSDGSATSTYNTSEPGTYTYTLEVMGCTTSASTTVDVIEYAIFDIGQVIELCPDDTLDLVIPYIGVWSTGDTTHTISVTQPGNYDVTVAIQHCASTDDVEVVAVPWPDLEVGPDLYLCPGEEEVLNMLEQENVDYLWNTGQTEPRIRLRDPGVYVLTAFNGCGSVSDTLRVFDDGCPPTFYAPNAFTPNNDGLNDVYQVYVYDVTDFRLQIYNRWGELCFETNDPGDAWTGDMQGAGYYVPNGTYVWKVTGKLPDYSNLDEMGYLTLIR